LFDISPEERVLVEALPWAVEAVAFKLAVRALLISRSEPTEHDALDLVRQSEERWPDKPHGMSIASQWGLSWIDVAKHARIRWQNWRTLAEALDGTVEIVQLSGGVPFNLSILVDNRSDLLARLRQMRVFATALWPDARHQSDIHPKAALLAQQLMGLPIDQRYIESDMQELGRRFKECLLN